MIELSFDIKPKSCPRPRLSHNHAFMPKEYMSFKKSLQYMAMPQLKKQGLKAPSDEPLCICLYFYFKAPKNKTAQAHTQKPDIDNLAKSVLDSFNNLIWLDDAQINELNIKKLYGAKNCIKMQIFFQNSIFC